MKLGVYVLGYGGGTATFKRHEPFWFAHKAPITVISPTDDPIRSNHRSILVGKSQHCGPENHRRTMAYIEDAVRQGHDFSVAYEYDSLSFDVSKFSFKQGLFCIAHANVNFHEYMAPQNCGFPWMIDLRSLRMILESIRRWPDVIENGYPDRLIAAHAYLARVPVLPYYPLGFFMNTILPEYYDAYRAALQACGVMVHGIKDERPLQIAREVFG